MNDPGLAIVYAGITVAELQTCVLGSLNACSFTLIATCIHVIVSHSLVHLWNIVHLRYPSPA